MRQGEGFALTVDRRDYQSGPNSEWPEWRFTILGKVTQGEMVVPGCLPSLGDQLSSFPAIRLYRVLASNTEKQAYATTEGQIP
jgi:hypothetical protein